MPLGAGSRIGGYEIIALIGSGGMGEVYRARDARLGRDVAVKVLSPRIAADASGVIRFEREARALATLNHPNIASIFGVEDGAGQPALILELIDGETLADRIARGPIPVNEALGYARQIADAIDAAHEAGIVHRDLKPGNVKVTDDGRVKVLDFGLAKALTAAAGQEPDDDLSNSPTITVHGTSHGVILGTAAYMSPEQARGKKIDKRTDIWAFGCVLFEMLAGRRLFTGETTSDLIAAIIERQPDLAALPPAVPRHVRRALAGCLEKDPKRRARDIADVARQLDDIDDGPPVSPGARRWRPATAAMAAVAALAVVGVAMVVWPRPPAPPPTPVEFTFGPPPNHTFAAFTAAPSPDGRRIAFVARDAQRTSSLWLRDIDSVTSRKLEGTEGAAGPGNWAPDGSALVFFDGSALKRVRVDGGPAVTIVPGMVADLGASWGADDVLVLAPSNRTVLSRVSATGGTLDALTTLDPSRENSHRWPQALPDGRHFLFTVRSDRPENLGIKIGAFDSAGVRLLVNATSQGKYAPPGWLLFMTSDEVLMAQRLDPETWTLSGSPQPVAAPVRYNGPSFHGVFDVSRDGRVLAYTPPPRGASKLVWFDRGGKMLGTLGPEQQYRGLRLSPAGRAAAVELADRRYGTRDIWLVDLTTQSLTRLTSNGATDWRPVFSPDGGSVAFASDRAGVSTIFRASTNGAGGETVLYRDPTAGAFPVDWSRDGRHVLVQVDDGKGPNELVSVPVDGGAPTPLVEKEPSNVMAARYSPEGDRIAFVSLATGNREVYVMSFADRRRVRISTDGGLDPAWGRDGSELFYQTTSGTIMRATLARGPVAISRPPEALFTPCTSIDMVYGPGPADKYYDVTADGSRFLAVCSAADTVPSAMTVVVNWQSKLR